MRRLHFFTVILVLLFVMPGCTWFAAKTLDTEQITALKEIMELKQSSGCFNSGAGAAFATAQGNFQLATCYGLEKKPTLDDYMNMMSGMVINVRPKE